MPESVTLPLFLLAKLLSQKKFYPNWVRFFESPTRKPGAERRVKS